ncbi:diacylglycerol/lipid kinase family protein [Microbacterium xanthum]|uniref:diacylglycerol/lipid kinase family protein n=1 Tax=Microbacterium xanthum TaxID=3079794 RepID=UPI002AD23C69|nr:MULTISPECIES: diacylglycerol kinase family protein [unclassified Microbacterium]MDZ8170783.1 diacylglycerol kinase family protein [Microbacterium sp. KSW-48]MDZ8201292.1 diacylglycerol kinase family protein [Microbacterium sp. SSW1-59]
MTSVRAAVIWNPAKTTREDLEDPLLRVFTADEIAWFDTTVEDPGQGVAARALETSPEVVIVAGGDGTVRAVAEHLADVRADVDLGIVPFGTGNLLARNLDVPLRRTVDAVERAASGQARPIDVGWVDVEFTTGTERHAFVVMIGFGIDANMIAETDESLKSKAGWLAYVESLGRALQASDLVSFTLTVDDGPGRDESGHTLLIGNCGSLQGGFSLLPDADPGDGDLDYLLLSAEGLTPWLGTLKTMLWDSGLGRMIRRSDASESADTDDVTHGRARRIRVSLPSPRVFEIDGEEVGEATGFTVSIQPAALRVR